MSQKSEMRLSPVEYAKKLLMEIDVRSAPIYPRKIAKQLGISVWEREADSGYDGYLISAEGNWGIMVNSAIRSKSRKRFTVAHELGHYYIDHHKETSYQCFGKDIGTIDSFTTQHEREANQFAVELLMPEEFFREDAGKCKIGLEAVNSLAIKYGTSMISTAIRYARSIASPCAMVVSEHGRIKYFAYSESFGKGRHLYLSRSTLLKEGSCAKRLLDSNLRTLEEQGEVLASSWSTGMTDPALIVREHSRCLPAFDQILSLIWLEEKRASGTQKPIAHVLVK